MPAEFIHDGTFLEDESQSSRSPLMTFGSDGHRDQPPQRDRLHSVNVPIRYRHPVGTLDDIGRRADIWDRHDTSPQGALVVRRRSGHQPDQGYGKLSWA
jgi:hypothetical protein